LRIFGGFYNEVRFRGSLNCSSGFERRRTALPALPLVRPRFLLLLGLRFLALLLPGATTVFILAAICASILGADLAHLLAARAGCGFLYLIGLFRVFQLHEVGNVEERVALQAHIDKSRLHARQYAGDAPVINGPRQGVFVFAFVINFRELIVFKNCKPRFVRRTGNTNFLCHHAFPSGGKCRPEPAVRSEGGAENRREWEMAEGTTWKTLVCQLLVGRQPGGAANRGTRRT